MFADAARLGARIRALQGFAADPAPAFRIARLLGQASGSALDVPPPRRAFVTDGVLGSVLLLPDGSLRMANVPETVWHFAVSGYPVLYRWLRARKGEALDSMLLRAALDVASRIAELLHLQDEADGVLARALEAPLKRTSLGLSPRDEAALVGAEPDDEAI